MDTEQRALTSILNQVKQAVGAPGIAAGISGGNKRIVAFSGLADSSRKFPLTRESRFGIACITKLLVSVVTHHLNATGVLSLDDKLIGVIPSLSGTNLAGRGIRIRDLLSHSAGYQGPLLLGGMHRSFTLAILVDSIGNGLQTFAPGSTFNYENTGHVLVGEIIEQITGRCITDWIDTILFQPLGIHPESAVQNYTNASRYVAPHRIDNGVSRAVAPMPFGKFWKSSLADWTLSIDDLLSLGEAIVGRRPEIDLSFVREVLAKSRVLVPSSVSGRLREHVPQYFNAICAEYGSGWFGYAGSALGQTCALRFDVVTGDTCVVGINSWLPIARDALIDKLCGRESHPDAGRPGGNSVSVRDLAGIYFGGGNIVRSVRVKISANSVICELGDDGLRSEPIRIELDENGNLVPDQNSLFPGLGFFRDSVDDVPCIILGSSSLKKSI